MATNFPTSVDVLTNPVSNDSLNSPSHSAQHANANDAIEAIEGYLLAGGAGNTGLVKIIPTGATNGTVAANGDVTIGSAVSSVAVLGAFSSAYDQYKILITGGGSSANNYGKFILGSATSGYYVGAGGANFSGTSTLLAANNAAAANYTWYLSTTALILDLDIKNPFLTKPTFFNFAFANTSGGAAFAGAGYHSASTSYTDFTLSSFGAETLTGGTIHLYGYK